MTKFIITGASGMIGSELVKLAVKKGIQVLAVVRKNSVRTSNIPNSELVKLVNCDLNEISMLPQIVDNNYDYFFHFAWAGVYGNERSNVLGQIDNANYALQAISVAKALGCKKFIFAGSQAEYGLQNTPLTCNTIEKPIMPYGIAKNYVTKIGSLYANQLGIEFCCGRILSAYGVNDNKTTLISSLITKIINGEQIDLSSGEQIWDYIYSSDVAEAFYRIAKYGVNGKSYPIGSGIGMPLKNYIKLVYDAIGNKQAKLNFGAIPKNDKGVKFLQADISELTKDTGFMPKVNFVDGIKKIIESR